MRGRVGVAVRVTDNFFFVFLFLLFSLLGLGVCGVLGVLPRGQTESVGQRRCADRRAGLGRRRHRYVDQRGTRAIRPDRCVLHYTTPTTRALDVSLFRSSNSFVTVGPFWAWKVGPADACNAIGGRAS